MQKNNYLLELKNITQRYGDNVVVQNMSLQLAQGKIGCLLGPSGCGKTTVLRCVAGFETVHSGEIVLAGSVIVGKNKHMPAEKRRIGMVFQDYALFPHLTASQNIAFGLKNFSAAQRKSRVMEMLELVNLERFAHLYPHELSGGQQQRVALVRALAPKPELLLLDEPFPNSISTELSSTTLPGRNTPSPIKSAIKWLTGLW